LPVIAAVVVLAELVGAVMFATGGSWLWCGLLVVVAVASVLGVLWFVARGVKPPPSESYVVREQSLW
jgi:hypothetical protein